MALSLPSNNWERTYLSRAVAGALYYGNTNTKMMNRVRFAVYNAGSSRFNVDAGGLQDASSLRTLPSGTTLSNADIVSTRGLYGFPLERMYVVRLSKQDIERLFAESEAVADKGLRLVASPQVLKRNIPASRPYVLLNAGNIVEIIVADEQYNVLVNDFVLRTPPYVWLQEKIDELYEPVPVSELLLQAFSNQALTAASSSLLALSDEFIRLLSEQRDRAFSFPG